MSENKSFLNAMTILGLLLAIGMASAAFILGVQAKRAVTGQQSITVKGLAEKPVKADRAEWTINIAVPNATQAGALKAVASTRQVVEAFLEKQGFAKDNLRLDIEALRPHYEEVLTQGRFRQVQKGYEAYQNIHITSKDLAKITAANKAFLQLRADNYPVVAYTPNYLVGNLEEIKMSLIAEATKNARTRATEFVKQDGASVGVIKSARQGVFSILPVGSSNEGDDHYGGVYDKTTIDKVVRIVVTIVYNIE
ncbi:MAG: SIMPL domain-containing protein [Methylophilaceae bacterium]